MGHSAAEADAKAVDEVVCATSMSCSRGRGEVCSLGAR
jgi:hypothetical protein